MRIHFIVVVAPEGEETNRNKLAYFSKIIEWAAVPRVGDLICPFRQRYYARVGTVRWFVDPRTAPGIDAEVQVTCTDEPENLPGMMEDVLKAGYEKLVAAI